MRYCCEAVRQCGSVAVWQCGSEAVWQCGSEANNTDRQTADRQEQGKRYIMW
jgi:hypothetical protein